MRGVVAKMAQRLVHRKKPDPILLPFNIDLFNSQPTQLPPKLATLLFLQNEQFTSSLCIIAENEAKRLIELQKNLQLKPRTIPDEVIIREIILNSDRFYRPYKKKRTDKKIDEPVRPILQKQKSFLWSDQSPYIKHHSITKTQSAPKTSIFKELMKKHMLLKSFTHLEPVIPLGCPPSDDVMPLRQLFLYEQFRNTIEACETFLHFERISCEKCILSECFLLSPLSPFSFDSDCESVYSYRSTGTDYSSIPCSPKLGKVCYYEHACCLIVFFIACKVISCFVGVSKLFHFLFSSS